jgi:hypothetical protein
LIATLQQKRWLPMVERLVTRLNTPAPWWGEQSHPDWPRVHRRAGNRRPRVSAGVVLSAAGEYAGAAVSVLDSMMALARELQQ